MENYTIIPAPYTVGPEAYAKVPEYSRLYGTRAVVIGGKKAMAAAREKLERAVAGSEIEIVDFVWYGTECTRAAAARLEALDSVRQADMIFAVGGGKAVDTCKLVSLDLKKPYLSFPTIASNCAASSALSIVYNEDGSFSEFVFFLECAKHVFIDTDIIARAPYRYMWAGIGDTYAKFYEVKISSQGEDLEHFKALGVNLSRMCMETLVRYGAQALSDNKAGRATYELEQAVLAIIITTGWVSMLVSREYSIDYNGGLGHAFYYGLCTLPGFEENHLHGVVVGFGVLVMLLVDGQDDECRRLMEFNKTVGLPTSLSELEVTLEQVRQCAEAVVTGEDMEHYPYKVTVDMLMDAVAKLDV